MSTYALTAPDKTEILTGTLVQIMNNLLDEWHATHTDGPGEDLYPFDYWSGPDCFMLDEDEQPPAKPDYTTDAAVAFASRVWDVPVKHITIEQEQ